MRILVHAFVLSVFMAVSGVAHAACPWGTDPINSAFATMTKVTINGKMYSVKGQAARAQFQAMIAECGAGLSATQAFRDWRAMRRATNWTGGIGICCFWPALLATPVTAIMAGEKKEQFIAMLLSGN